MADLIPSLKQHVYWPHVKESCKKATAKEPNKFQNKKKTGYATVPPIKGEGGPQDNSKLSTCWIATLLLRLHCSIKTTTWESNHRRSTGLQTRRDARQADQDARPKARA